MSKDSQYRFNPPPGWPQPPKGWIPPKGWEPDPSWPEAPDGWQLWILDGAEELPTQELVENGTRPESNQNVEHQHDEQLHQEFKRLKEENERLRETMDTLSNTSGLVELDDDVVLQEVGIYRYHHPLENAEAYKERLKNIEAGKKNLVKTGHAIEKSNMFTYDNSLAKGRKMSSDLSKLMLRAYNAEADNCVRSLKAGNVVTAKKRIDKTRDTIAKLGKMMEMYISDSYHNLQIEELELTSDYLMKKQEEKEFAREERSRLREEKKVEKEIAAAKEKLEKERAHILNTIATLEASGSSDESLSNKLAEIDEAIVQNDYRAANIRAGYVYVVSNRGAFGENVVKIGLTRRLEPIERVNELGGASVPFRFDVHTLFFSEDAVSLETELHQYFKERRVNHANSRKEFFFASPREVLDVLNVKVGNLLEYSEHADATEYLQSLKYWPADRTN